MMNPWELILVAACLFFCAGCSDPDGGRPEDGGADGADAADAVGPSDDVAPEEGLPDGDAAGDEYVDAAVDGDAEPDGDAGPDGDEASDDGEPPIGCPGAEVYQGDEAWGGLLSVSADTCLLVPCHEMGTLEEALAEKAVAWIAAGSYRMPIEVGTYPILLPVCVRLASQPEVLVPEVPGEVVVRDMFGYLFLTLTQPVAGGASQGFEVQLNLYVENQTEVIIEMAMLRMGPESIVSLVPNDFAWYSRWRHTVTFDRGELTSDFFAMWGGTPSSGLLVRAAGALDGVAFEQTDYWALVALNYHHFFGADWAVLFKTPIGSACGLRITSGMPIGVSWPSDPPALHTIDCTLAPLEPMLVRGETRVSFEQTLAPCPEK